MHLARPKKLLVIVLAIIAGIVVFNSRRNGAEYNEFANPDKRFKIVVYQARQVPMMMPGQSGDAPGYVCLYKMASGELLERKPVEMVQRIDQIMWSDTNVDIKLFADWKLR